MSDTKFILFCFPFAGGTADFYNNLEIACENYIKIIKLEYSGHGTRMKEPLYFDFREMTNDLYPKIIEVLDEFPNASYGMMGYSMGSISMFDMLMRILNEHTSRTPCRVFISAHQPQPIRALRDIPQDRVDDWVKERTIEFGGIDRRLINNESFWRVYLPIFRADYQMIAAYDFTSIQFKTEIPATVFYSEEDTPYEEMVEWTRYFVSKCEFIQYTGNHFFIEKYYKDMAAIIINQCNVAMKGETR